MLADIFRKRNVVITISWFNISDKINRLSSSSSSSSWAINNNQSSWGKKSLLSVLQSDFYQSPLVLHEESRVTRWLD